MSTTVDVAKIDSLEAQVKQLDSALQASRKIRLLILVAVLALLALIIYLFVGMFQKIASKDFQAEVAKEAQIRFEQNQERYVNDIRSVVEKASPVVRQAFYQQTKQDMPKYSAALEVQRELFTKDLQSRLESRLKEKYSNLMNVYEDQLVKEFPELKDEVFREKVIRSLDKAMGELATKYYTEQLGTAIGGLYEDWDQFPPADQPAMSEPQLGDQLIGTLLELASHRLSE